MTVVQNTLDLVLPREVYMPSRIDLYERMRAQPEGSTLTREELEQIAREDAERMRRDQYRNALRSLLGSLALVLIAAPVYVYHWRQVRRSEG